MKKKYLIFGVVLFVLCGFLVAWRRIPPHKFQQAGGCQAGFAIVSFNDAPVGFGSVDFQTLFSVNPSVTVTVRDVEVGNRVSWQAIGHSDHADFVGRVDDAGSARETVLLNWIACVPTQ